MITLIFVRHGETTWNIKGKIQGSSDTSILNKTGKNQALAVAKRLSQLEIDVIYASRLKRAKQTAKFISQATNKKIVVRKSFNERSFGVLEGKNVDYVFGFLNAMPKDTRFLFKPKDGESSKQVYARVQREIRKILKLHEGKTVVVITHGGVIKHLINMFKKFSDGKTYDERIKNASLTMFKIHEEIIIEELINDTEHLEKSH